MDERMGIIKEAAAYIRSRVEAAPEIGIILGSGLGPLVDSIEQPVEIEYTDIPGFPVTTVAGHSGKLVSGMLSGKPVIAMKGRFHYYEGYDISQVVFHIRVFKLLGLDNLLVTNAAGGVNKDYKPGDLMLITDHISLFGPSPLRGPNYDDFGPRFPDMSEVYSKCLIDLARKLGEREDMYLKEGVYAFTQGPMYETPADIRALRGLGADAVGMSTVPEAIAARHAGMKTLGISCITNMAAGVSEQPLNHEEVIETAKQVEKKFMKLVKKIVGEWPV